MGWARRVRPYGRKWRVPGPRRPSQCATHGPSAGASLRDLTPCRGIPSIPASDSAYPAPRGSTMDMKRVRRAAPMVAVLTFAGASLAGAQDSNYWTNAYGTRSQLLGGVVVGSPGDISSTYYNPGALALTQSTELLLAGNAYQYQR